jgi:hypothetical protein
MNLLSEHASASFYYFLKKLRNRFCCFRTTHGLPSQRKYEVFRIAIVMETIGGIAMCLDAMAQ